MNPLSTFYFLFKKYVVSRQDLIQSQSLLLVELNVEGWFLFGFEGVLVVDDVCPNLQHWLYLGVFVLLRVKVALCLDSNLHKSPFPVFDYFSQLQFFFTLHKQNLVDLRQRLDPRHMDDVLLFLIKVNVFYHIQYAQQAFAQIILLNVLLFYHWFNCISPPQMLIFLNLHLRPAVKPLVHNHEVVHVLDKPTHKVFLLLVQLENYRVCVFYLNFHQGIFLVLQNLVRFVRRYFYFNIHRVNYIAVRLFFKLFMQIKVWINLKTHVFYINKLISEKRVIVKLHLPILIRGVHYYFINFEF